MTTEYSIDNGASWHAPEPGHLELLEIGQTIIYRTAPGTAQVSDELVTVRLTLPEGAIAALLADIKKALKLADTVGKSRESNGYARNSAAVDALVTLQMSIDDQIKAIPSSVQSTLLPSGEEIPFNGFAVPNSGKVWLPCPFCGGKPTLQTDRESGYWVECSNPACGCLTTIHIALMDDVTELLREQWNRRTDAGQGKAAADLLAERRRQVELFEWDADHDDAHPNGEIAAYAAFYAMPEAVREWPATETGYGDTFGEAIIPAGWSVPKTDNRRRELVKAGALVLAEIERIDRAADKQPATPSRALADNDGGVA